MNDLKSYRWAPQLSDREIHFVGSILVHWGAIEHEVFNQTLASYLESEDHLASLPKAMNNLQFSEVLSLWKERVAEHACGSLAEVFRHQYQRITHLKPYRDALVHGRWDWSATDLSQITTIRVKKKDVITTRFTADDLEKFEAELANINFLLRWPGGPADRARELGEDGFYISRRALAIFSNSPKANDWLTLAKRPGTQNGGDT